MDELKECSYSGLNFLEEVVLFKKPKETNLFSFIIFS
jgi:hypothetical protein